MKLFSLVFVISLPACDCFLLPNSHTGKLSRTTRALAAKESVEEGLVTRRDVFHIASLVGGASILAPKSVGASDEGSLDDLPPNAVSSYMQYRMPLQTSADFYVWDLQEKVKNVDDWGEIGELFQVKSARGGGQPSRIEREYTNPMRILGLSFPPDVADRLRESQFRFEKAMGKITQATAGVRRDLPIEIDKNAVASASEGWEEGRVALNEFFDTLNEATGLSEMKGIPPSGPDQTKQYGRSKRKYLDLMKVTKLCQNRGGPTLSQAWGQLMVTGTVQDPCGISGALEDYFFQ